MSEQKSNTELKITFTRKDVLDGLRELYTEWCRMKALEQHCSRVRLPDYEAMLDQLEKQGMPADFVKTWWCVEAEDELHQVYQSGGKHASLEAAVFFRDRCVDSIGKPGGFRLGTKFSVYHWIYNKTLEGHA